MSRRKEHNMWSEESRGQQRGARGQQFKPEWTVMGVDREGEERMMSRAAPQRWVGRSGGFRKNQGMRLQDLLHNGQKRCVSLS